MLPMGLPPTQMPVTLRPVWPSSRSSRQFIAVPFVRSRVLPAENPLGLGRVEEALVPTEIAADRHAREVLRGKLAARHLVRRVGGDDVKHLVAGELAVDGKQARLSGGLAQGIGPEVLGAAGLGIVEALGGYRPIGNDPVEANAGDAEVWIPAHEGVGLLLANPLREAVGFLG